MAVQCILANQTNVHKENVD